jgi:hypothetical protein
VDVLGHRKKLADIKKEWGAVAAKAYNGSSKANGESAQASDQAAPTPLRKTQQGDTGFKVYASDPNDPRFKYPVDVCHPVYIGHNAAESLALSGHMTPLGMLLEVQSWCERYGDRVDRINQVLAAERTPGFNPFSFLRMMVDECIEREVPGYEYDSPYYKKDEPDEEVC